MDISVILPTRGRYGALRKSLDSLRQTATDPHSFEVLLGMDDDDLETLQRLNEDPIEDCQVFVGPRLGYVELHQYVNTLCAKSSGDWLFLWNDDALMQTAGWDDVVRSFSGQFLLLNPNSNHDNHARGGCQFPIVPRAWFEALGHIALNNHYDTWLEVIANRLGIRQNVPIYVLHDRHDLTGANDDATAGERVFTSDLFYSREVQAIVLAECATLEEEISS